MNLDNTEVVVSLLGIEANTIIACSAKEPYGEVYKLIETIRSQAEAIVADKKPEDATTFQFEIHLSGKDVRQVCSILNKHPFDQVYQLIENIRGQVIPQLEAAEQKTEGEGVE